MSAIELDLPVLMSAEQIRRREFVTIRRGYDPDQVRDYLDQLADQVDLMASMIREARTEAQAAIRAGQSPKIDPYERLAERVASVIREADDVAERTRSDAAREAEGLLARARADSDRIRSEAEQHADRAREEAERSVHQAREQASRTVEGLSTRREALVSQLAEMQERLLGVARELEDAIVMPETVADPAVEASTPSNGVYAQDPTADVIVDVRAEEPEPFAAPAEAVSGLDDPSYEELWEGTDAIHIQMPDIPPLDLSWDEDEPEAR